MGYFHVLKLAFLSSLTRKYILWEGFYHDFSTKKASTSGGFAPWHPQRGSAPWTSAMGCCPLDPQGNFAPSNDLPWCRPWSYAPFKKKILYKIKVNKCCMYTFSFLIDEGSHMYHINFLGILALVCTIFGKIDFFAKIWNGNSFCKLSWNVYI